MEAFDNFDHEEATLSGIGVTHNPVLIFIQEKPEMTKSKRSISETNVVHGAKQFNQEINCQVLQDYVKPAKKSDVTANYKVADDIYNIAKSELDLIETKHIAWTLIKLDLSDLDNMNEIYENQTRPSWSAFNSVITEETLPAKIVGFLPVLPHPVTQYTTVHTALRNFQDVLSQLKQSHIVITCDDGVYHIAPRITLHRPRKIFQHCPMYGIISHDEGGVGIYW